VGRSSAANYRAPTDDLGLLEMKAQLHGFGTRRHIVRAAERGEEVYSATLFARLMTLKRRLHL
jgi:hypothetical protein